MPSAARAPMSRATILSWLASGLPVPNDVVGFTPASALLTTPSMSIERRVTTAYSFSSTCVLLRVMMAVERIAQRRVQRVDAHRAARAHLVLQRIAARDEHRVARRGNAGEQRVGGVARHRDVAEPAAPTHRRTFGAVRLPHRLLVVVREQLGRQRIRHAIRALVLRERGRLDQRPDVELHGETARVPEGLESRELRRQRVLKIVGEHLAARRA